jgi:hypothetical protein
VLVALAVAAAVLAIAAAALLVRPVRVRAQVRASVDPGGAWQAAAGGEVWPFAFTAGIAPGGSAWTAHALGRRLAQGTRLPRAIASRAARPAPEAGATFTWRRFDTALAMLRRVRFDRLDARIHGAAGDPATSARVLGVVTAAGAALAPRARIATDVDWMADAPFVDVDCDLEASFVPLLLGWDVARATLSRSPEVRPKVGRRPEGHTRPRTEEP